MLAVLRDELYPKTSYSGSPTLVREAVVVTVGPFGLTVGIDGAAGDGFGEGEGEAAGFGSADAYWQRTMRMARTSDPVM